LAGVSDENSYDQNMSIFESYRNALYGNKDRDGNRIGGQLDVWKRGYDQNME